MSNEQKFHTDTNYLSIEEFKNKKGDKYTKESWVDVLEYRLKYTFEIPLIFNSSSYVHLTQTPWILQKEIKMISDFSTIQQAMLTSLSTKYSSSTLLDDIEMKSITADIHYLMNIGCKKNVISRTIIDNLINRVEEPKNDEDWKIIKLYDNMVVIINKLTSPREIAKIFFGFKDFEKKKFNDIHTSLVETVKSDKINSLLTKASAIIFGIFANNIFGKDSYDVAILSIISLLRNSYQGEILKGISFFKISDYFKFEINNAIEIGLKDNGDLTYLISLFSSVMMYSIRLSSEQIETYIKNEIRYNSLSLKDKNINIKLITKENPELSKKQIKFFVEHSDIRSNYTVKDFQEYFGTSYETARYSLENLVEKKFYKKKKVGKKYVYTSIRQ